MTWHTVVVAAERLAGLGATIRKGAARSRAAGLSPAASA